MVTTLIRFEASASVGVSPKDHPKAHGNIKSTGGFGVLEMARLKMGCLAWMLWIGACGHDPETMVVGRWQEASWRYEKFDGYSPSEEKWIDGIRLPAYPSRRVVRHEAEYWEFRPDHTLIISTRSGQKIRARWRLKGRGHVLTVRYPDSDEVEIYDVKELSQNEMVLNYDIGMEVRGIAQLTFRRLDGKGSGTTRAPATAKLAELEGRTP
jgi:hypothetical protein